MFYHIVNCRTLKALQSNLVPLNVASFRSEFGDLGEDSGEGRTLILAKPAGHCPRNKSG